MYSRITIIFFTLLTEIKCEHCKITGITLAIVIDVVLIAFIAYTNFMKHVTVLWFVFVIIIIEELNSL